MSGFAHVQLAEDEVLVIGPMKFSSSSSFSVNSGGNQSAQVQRANITIIGITNQRLIVEDVDTPKNTKIVNNTDVKRIYLKRSTRGAEIEKVEVNSGASFNVGIKGLNPQQHAMLYKLFPNAEVGRKKGLFGGFAKIAAPAAIATAQLGAIPQRPKPAPPAGKPQAGKPKAGKPKAAKAKTKGMKPKNTPPPAAPATGRSHISDPDVHGADDLRRLYPLPDGYDYIEADGDLRVKRLSDGATFPILAEEGLLGFDVPVLDNPKRRKKTIEVFRKG